MNKMSSFLHRKLNRLHQTVDKEGSRELKIQDTINYMYEHTHTHTHIYIYAQYIREWSPVVAKSQ